MCYLGLGLLGVASEDSKEPFAFNIDMPSTSTEGGQDIVQVIISLFSFLILI